jgi:tetratricopeptide (TPR) repeat protein
LTGQGRLDEALAHYQKALETVPDFALAHCSVGAILTARGRLDEALAHSQRAVELEPNNAMIQNTLGNVLAMQGRLDEAFRCYQKSLEIQPNFPQAHANLGDLSAVRGQFHEALAHYRKALEIQPGDPMTQRRLAWLRATCPVASLRNGDEAMALADRANQLCGGKQPEVLDTLAAAYAEAGWFAEAQATARKALEVATQQNNHVLVSGLRDRIALYEARRPYRQTPLVPVPSPEKP